MGGIELEFQVAIVADVARTACKGQLQLLQSLAYLARQGHADGCVVAWSVACHHILGAGLHCARLGILYLDANLSARAVAGHFQAQRVDTGLLAYHIIGGRASILDVAYVAALVHHASAIAASR